MVVVALCGLAAAAGWVTAPPAALWWLALAGWVIGGAAAVKGGPAGWGPWPALLRLAVGVLLLVVGCLMTTGEAILEPQHTQEAQLDEACAALTA